MHFTLAKTVFPFYQTLRQTSVSSQSADPHRTLQKGQNEHRRAPETCAAEAPDDTGATAVG